MTTEERVRTAVGRCEHAPGAICWLCSDAVAWWRDARGGGDPPNAPCEVSARRKRWWSLEEERVLEETSAAGLCFTEIASLIGRTPMAVQAKYYAMGLIYK